MGIQGDGQGDSALGQENTFQHVGVGKLFHQDTVSWVHQQGCQHLQRETRGAIEVESGVQNQDAEVDGRSVIDKLSDTTQLTTELLRAAGNCHLACTGKPICCQGLEWTWVTVGHHLQSCGQHNEA